MIATIWPGADRVRGGRGHVRVHVADRNGDPAGQAGPDRCAGGERARPAAERGYGVGQLVVGEPGEIGMQGGQELARRIMPVLPDALVPGGARVPGLGAGQLPDDPVGGLDPPVGEPVDVRVLLQQLQRLRELPLSRDLPAVAGEPRLAADARQLVDPVRLRLAGVVLPELRVGVRAVPQLHELAERGPVGQDRQHRAGREVGADADHLRRVDARVGDRGRHGMPQHVPVILGILQRPVRRQRAAGGCQHGVHHAVPVLMHGGAELRAVGYPDHQRPPGQRAEVDADDVTAPGMLLAFTGSLWPIPGRA